MVREPLIWLGDADPVASMDQARKKDDGLNTIGDLFELWENHLVADVAFSALEIVAKANERVL